MRKPVFRVFGGFAPRFVPFSGAAGVLLCGACIFSPVTKIPVFPVSQTSVYDSVTMATADIEVELFEPYLDRRLQAGAQTNLAQADPVRVRERESGRVVEYRYSRRGYGSWNAERERQLHLFLLRSYFFHPGVYDDSTGSGNLDSLYARARPLDPYTRRIDSVNAEEHRRQSRTTVRPRVLGIQVRVNDAGDSLYLEVVAPGSPADKAGLRRGMQLLAINDSLVTGDSAAARFTRFIAADTVTTVLTVGTAEGTRREVVGRDTASFPTVQADSLGGAGYIAIYSFTQSTIDGGSTHDEFKKALEITRHFPSTVLDLRDNGGGSLQVVLLMCDEVLSGGVIIRLVERNLEGGASLRAEKAYRANAGQKYEGRDFVLLANEWSASASEIFIAALRENLSTPFIGTRTYGKGVGQASFDTPGGEIAIMTYGTARAASGLDYNGVGLQPTHPSTAKPDAMLAQAAEVAAPGALARRAAGGLPRSDAHRAALIEWNRRQAVRPDVVEWNEPGVDIRP